MVMSFKDDLVALVVMALVVVVFVVVLMQCADVQAGQRIIGMRF